MKILIAILVLTMVGLLIGFAKAILRPYHSNLNDKLDKKYLNDEGFHLYYDKSIIEKKEFKRRFPNMAIRKFSHLFSKGN